MRSASTVSRDYQAIAYQLLVFAIADNFSELINEVNHF